MFAKWIERLQGRIPKGHERSSEWEDVRNAWVAANPVCAVCGGTKKLQVHHLAPFHLAPELELDQNNLITLCTRKKYGINCHLLIGHLGNFRRVNKDCEEDAKVWCAKLSKKP